MEYLTPRNSSFQHLRFLYFEEKKQVLFSPKLNSVTY